MRDLIPTPSFTGFFIPVEILSMENLSTTEIMLLSWIDAFRSEEHGRSCFASNAYFAKKLRLKENTIKIMISKLKSLGLIEQVSFDGRIRILRACKEKWFSKKRNQSTSEVEKNQRQGLKKINLRGLEKSPDHIYIENKEENKEEIKKSAGKADASFFSGFDSSLSSYQTSSQNEANASLDQCNITYNTGPTNNGHSYNKLEINSSNNKLNITNPKDSQTKSNSPPSQELIERRQNVHTSDFQHQNLVEKHGKELVELSYDDLSLWKSNKTSKELAKATDYGRLTKWVINSVRELQIKEKELKQREERLKGKSYANSKDDIRKSQDDEYFKNNGNPDENPRIRRFKNEIK